MAKNKAGVLGLRRLWRSQLQEGLSTVRLATGPQTLASQIWELGPHPLPYHHDPALGTLVSPKLSSSLPSPANNRKKSPLVLICFKDLPTRSHLFQQIEH